MRYYNGKETFLVIGMGYVGLPLAIEFALSHINTIGFDNNEGKVDYLNKGMSYIPDVSSEKVDKAERNGDFYATTDEMEISEADVISICVPTPLDKNKNPDLFYIREASKSIGRNIKQGALVVLESTTYPGTTREIVKPIIEKESGLTCGTDFFLAFSPERVDPGNKNFAIKNTTKVIGGIDERSMRRAQEFYSIAVDNIHLVSSVEAAEMTKLLENIFRNVNIALVNELSLISRRMGINIWEVINAASTKPFGFMPFYPGPGVGGHCIPIDPFYLSWKAREYDFYANFIEYAAEINENMPYHVVDLVIKNIARAGVSINNASILVLGVAFKRDIDDSRHSPAYKIFQLLNKEKAKIYYNDPFVPEYKVDNELYHSRKVTENLLAKTDCVLILTDHSVYDYKFIVKKARLIIDTRNATGKVISGKRKIIVL